MKPSDWMNLIPLHLTGTLSTAAADYIGIMLVAGVVIALLVMSVGRYWLTPYLAFMKSSRRTSQRKKYAPAKDSVTKRHRAQK